MRKRWAQSWLSPPREDCTLCFAVFIDLTSPLCLPIVCVYNIHNLIFLILDDLTYQAMPHSFVEEEEDNLLIRTFVLHVWI